MGQGLWTVVIMRNRVNREVRRGTPSVHRSGIKIRGVKFLSLSLTQNPVQCVLQWMEFSTQRLSGPDTDYFLDCN